MSFPKRSTRSLIHTSLATGLLLVTVMPLSGGCAAQKKPEPKPAAFWPPYPDEPRIQHLVSFDASSDVAPEKSSLDRLIYGKEIEQVLALKKPYGVEMFNGRIYVCDLRNGCVTVLDLRKKETLILGRSGNDTLEKPTDIAIATDGMKYVADNGKGRIYVFGPDERQLGSFGASEMRPTGIAVRGDELFVTDFKSQRVLVFDRNTGSVTRTIGEPGSGPGQFVRPLGIDVDDQGFVYVMDVLKCQLQKFDPSGKLVTSFGTTSANAGGFVRPKQIAVDKDRQLYVVDSAFQNVQMLDQVGRPLTFFGAAGTHPGNMFNPVGITVHEGDLELFAAYVHPAFEAKRLVLVTNQFGDNKVSVFAFGNLKAGKTVADLAGSQGIVPSGVGDDKARAPGAPPPGPVGPDDELGAPSTQPTIAGARTTPKATPAATPAPGARVTMTTQRASGSGTASPRAASPTAAPPTAAVPKATSPATPSPTPENSGKR